MHSSRFRLAWLGLASSLTLSGCAYDMYGSPYGYGYGPYSGASVGVGVGYGGYGYGGYGYGYGYDPFGWYGDYYYPGVGIYVYDHHHNRHVWNDQQRHYWQDRHNHWQSHGAAATATGTAATSENWSGWNRSSQRNSYTRGSTSSSQGAHSNWQGRSSATTQSTTRSSTPNSDRSSTTRSVERAGDRPQ